MKTLLWSIGILIACSHPREKAYSQVTASGIEYFKSFSSVYDRDFVFLRKINSNCVFAHYSSGVGYTTLVIVNENKDLLITDKINEDEVVMMESTAPGESFLKVKDQYDKVALKRLPKVNGMCAIIISQ